MAVKRIKHNKEAGDFPDLKSAFLEALEGFGEDPTIQKMEVQETFVPMGSIILDHVLQLKGIPGGGRVIQIHGKEHGGKSTLCYNIVKSYQRLTGKAAAIFDFEGTSTPEYFKSNGVNTDRDALVVFKNNSVEAAVQKSMVDEKEIMNGKAFKNTVGQHAKTMNMFFDLLLPYAQHYDCVLIMVNQIRARIDGSREGQSAAKYSTITNLNYILPGGYAMRFIPSLTIEVNVAKALRAGGGESDWDIEPGENKGNHYVATRIAVRVLKNKVTMGGYRAGELYLRSGLGLDDNISIRELAFRYKLIAYVGKKWIVGLESDPIAVYDSKDSAIRDLVIEQNPVVLSKLRELVVTAIESDEGGFLIQPSEEDLASSDEDFYQKITTKVAFDDDEQDLS
jgi:RecA/RadA recombinase